MEIIFIVLIFIVPGIVIKRASEEFEKREIKEKERATTYESLFDICVLSIIASGITILILNFNYNRLVIERAATFEELFRNLGNFNYLIKYIAVLTFVALVEFFLFKKYLKKKRNWNASNWKEDFGLTPMSEDHGTVWEELFLNKERNLKTQIVSIYKDGNYITSGCLQGRNVDPNEGKEFELLRTTEVEAILNRDKELPPGQKALNYIKDSYFDMETGVLIIFYDSDYAIEHWDEITQEIYS